MTIHERFLAVLARAGGDPGSPHAGVAAMWFEVGFREAAQLVRQQRPKMRMVVGADGKYRQEVDLPATLQELHKALDLPCERPSG